MEKVTTVFEANVEILNFYRSTPATPAPLGGDFETEAGARRWLALVKERYGDNVVGESLLKVEKTVLTASGSLKGSTRTPVVEHEVRRDQVTRTESARESQSHNPESSGLLYTDNGDVVRLPLGTDLPSDDTQPQSPTKAKPAE